MRYSEAHAAKSGSVPFALRGPKSVRMVLATAVAGAIGLVPAVAVSTPAFAGDDLTGIVNITPSNASGTEGDTLTYSVTNLLDEKVNLGVAAAGSGDHQAKPGTDFTAPPTTLQLAAKETKYITVKTTDDSLYETTETFQITVSKEGGGSDPRVLGGTIYDNDPEPSYTLTATPATVTEPKLGDTTSTIKATLSAKSGVPTTIKLNTADGTAKSGYDYTPLEDKTITIDPNTLSNSTTVEVKGDGVKDTADIETFKVNGSADNATPSDASATVSIADAQTTPVLVLTQDDDAATEDTAGITYTVTSSVESELPVTVRWDAVPVTPEKGDDAATPGQDFTYPSSRTVTLTRSDGVESGTFTIPFKDDGLNENDEQFGVQLAAPANATLDSKKSMVTSTIEDKNTGAAPEVSLSPASVTEGNAGKTTKTFTAKLSQKSGRTVTVGWATNSTDGATATQGKDYVANKGTLVFPAGVTSETFTVDIIGDTAHEGDETFNIALSTPDKTAAVPDDAVPITITDDDSAPTMTFDSVTIKEGEATTPVMLQIKLSNPSAYPIKFNVNADSDSGAGVASGELTDDPGSGDYTLLTTGDDAVTIRPGQTVGYVPLLVNGDDMFESDEVASITATPDCADADPNCVSDKTPDATAKVTLLNDDKAPSLSIDSVTANEGDSVSVTGTVQGSTDQDSNFSITFAGGSVNGSQAADSKDFTNPGTLTGTIAAGATTGDTVEIGDVDITDDPDKEGPETIVVSGTPQSGSQGAVVPGAITIAASDGGATTPPVTPTVNVPANVVGAVALPITGKATAGQDVELWGAPISSAKPALVKLQTMKATAGGAYAFSRWIGQGFRFAIRVGTWTSPEKQVTVTQDPVFVASTTKGMASFAAQGSPRAAGQTVIVQRYVSGKWVEIARGLTGSTNQWKGSVKIASGTAVAVRAFVVGDTTMGIMGGYSDIKRFTIK